MRIDGINLVEGSKIQNLVVNAGTSFPLNPDTGELFIVMMRATKVCTSTLVPAGFAS